MNPLDGAFRFLSQHFSVAGIVLPVMPRKQLFPLKLYRPAFSLSLKIYRPKTGKGKIHSFFEPLKSKKGAISPPCSGVFGTSDDYTAVIRENIS